jgi:hypothetical protein
MPRENDGIVLGNIFVATDVVVVVTSRVVVVWNEWESPS